MIVLTIDNSYSRIEGLTSEQHKKLREVLSYKIDDSARYFSGSFRSSKRYLISARGDFPTGLLYLVEGYLNESDLFYKEVDRRIAPKASINAFQIDLKGKVAYPEQEAAAEAANAFQRGIITAPTGCGKTLIMALIISKLKVPTLIVVPTLELKRQTKETLTIWFGSLEGIQVENIDALDPGKVETKAQLLILDEFHHSAAKTYQRLNKKAWGGIYHRIGLTATPWRTKENENILLEAILSKVIYKILYQDAVAKGYIVPVEAYYYELPKRKVKGVSWSQVYSELVVNNKERNNLIADLLESLWRSKKPTLCLVKEVLHGHNLGTTAFAHGMNDETPQLIEWFNNKSLTSLIGTNGVLGEGIDTKPAEYIIIAGLGKSKNAFIQQIGRGLRTYPGKESCKVILFKDESHKWCKAHFAAQVKILKDEYNVIPVKLEVDKY